jgi:hypothetical protein
LEAAAQGTPAVGIDHQGFGANYIVDFKAFVEVDPGQTSEVLGAAFAESIKLSIATDYVQSSEGCIALAQSHLYVGRAEELLARLA